MRRIIITGVLGGVFGGMLVYVGVKIDQWEYWVFIGWMIIFYINAAID